MKKTVLIVDGSVSMGDSGEYLPNKMLAMRNHLHSFIHEYFKMSPMSQLSTVVLRDGVAHRITGMTNDPQETIAAIESRIMLQTPSGAISMENGVRVALIELAQNTNDTVDGYGNPTVPATGKLEENAEAKKKALLEDLLPQQQSRRKLTAAPALLSPNSRICLLLGSVTVVDPGNVLTLIDILGKSCVVCDVLSLVGAPHIAQQLTVSTGGKLLCPLSHSALERQVKELAQRSALGLKSPKEGAGEESAKKGGNGAAKGKESSSTLWIGFPMKIPEAGTPTSPSSKRNAGTASAAETLPGMMCPRCHAEVTDLPTTCNVCGLQVCSVHHVHASFCHSNNLLVGFEKVKLRQEVANNSSEATAGATAAKHVVHVEPDKIVSCGLCGNDNLMATTGGSSGAADGKAKKRKKGEARRCLGCGHVVCGPCFQYVNVSLKFCPQCL